MKLQSVNIKNFRCFEDITIHFHKRLTVLVGGNGSGKSAVLDAIAPELASIILCCIQGSVSQRNSSFTKKDIHLNQPNSTVNLMLSILSNNKNLAYNAKLSKLVQSNLQYDNQYLALQNFLSHINSLDLSKNISKYARDDVFVYYQAKRLVKNIQFNKLESIEKIYAYQNMLNQEIDTSASLSWFDNKDAEQARIQARKKDFSIVVSELKAVQDAISNVLQEYRDPHMAGSPAELMVVEKDNPNNIVSLAQLSDGYRTMLALVMDLARRMAIANAEEYNKQGKSVLESPAIVLIDEVDLHLHPSWQQRVLPDLMRTFPNTQFIVTTHSPQVISSIASEHIRVLEDGKVYGIEEVTEGVDAASILQDVFEVNPLPQNIQWAKDLSKLKKLIYSEDWDSSGTKHLLAKLEKHYGKDYPVLYEMRLHVENLEWEREHENSD